MKPTPSMAVALMALVFSMLGTGYAAKSLIGPRGHAGPKGAQGPRGELGLQGESVHGPEGPKGGTGPEGQQGRQGPTGPEGIALSTLKATHNTATIAPKVQGHVFAVCPKGSRIVGGGGNGLGQPIVVSEPTANEWLIEVNNTTASPLLIEATAICAEP